MRRSLPAVYPFAIASEGLAAWRASLPLGAEISGKSAALSRANGTVPTNFLLLSNAMAL